jgi:DHA1 family bicyclomycin/chloramphenicol resistance-like MFS transporter
MTRLRYLWARWFSRETMGPLIRPRPTHEEFEAGWQRFADGDPDLEGIARQIGQVKQNSSYTQIRAKILPTEETMAPTDLPVIVPPTHSPMGFVEFVAAIGSLMALTALTTDIMLPALPQIGAALGTPTDNDRQSVITIFLLGFGIGQLFIGSISDKFGRRSVLLLGLLFYAATSILCALTASFEILLAARLLQGIAAAVPRVITVAVVRDCYGGRQMARVMSFALMLLIAVPVFAPGIGQIILMTTTWRTLFVLLAVYAIAQSCWMFTRLPETADVRNQKAAGQALSAIWRVFSNRQTMGYAIACGAMYGALFSFILSAQQIFGEMFALGAFFPLVFGAIALCAAFSSFANALIVQRLGMRKISKVAIAAYILISVIMTALAYKGMLGLTAFTIACALCMALLGLIFSNLNALAMEPQGRIAGTASSILGFITTVSASLIGYFVGSLYNQTALPLSASFLACSTFAAVVVLLTERTEIIRNGLERHRRLGS